jgi:hypothetical protein
MTDNSGSFSFDSLYVSQPPVLQYDRIVIEPEIPLAYTTLKSISVDTVGLSLIIDLVNADVLIVSATDNEKYSPYYQVALESIATSYTVWNSSVQGSVPLSRGLEFKKKTIIYYTGDLHVPLVQNDLDSLTACLRLGCNLFLTGQDIAEMNDSSDLMKNYLSVGFGGNSTFSFVTGLTGGLFNRIEFSTNTTDDANNQTSRDILSPLDSRVKPQMGYGSGIRGTAALRIDSVGAGGKAIVMGFGFEAISTAPSRQEVMQKIIGYFDGSIVLGVNDDILQMPTAFRLEQNYPNPFNPKTIISYSLPAGQAGLSVNSRVSLKLYDMLGREAATLVNERKEPGTYTASWDASGFASGVYFYELRAGNLRETKKMLLVR